MEMASHGITVNAYAPGIVGTAMWDLIDEELGKLKGAKKGDTIKRYSEDLIALGRTSVPEDVSSTVSWLAGKDSNYGMKSYVSPFAHQFLTMYFLLVTGQTIVVDGGIIFT